jgi:hypothetical protein
MDTEKVKDTIRKLLNLAANEGAAEGEIANAMKFAAKLMQQHQLREEDLQGTTVDALIDDLDKKECSSKDVIVTGRRQSIWEGSVALFVCKLVGGVKCYWSGMAVVRDANGIVQTTRRGDLRERSQIRFYGITEDVLLAADLYYECLMVISSMAKLKWGGVQRGPGRSYCEGFAQALWEKLQTAQAQITQENRGSTGTALVVVQNRDAIVKRKTEIADRYIEQRGVKIRKAKSQTRNVHYDGEAFMDGREDGTKHKVSADRKKKLQ